MGQKNFQVAVMEVQCIRWTQVLSNLVTKIEAEWQ